ncbi:hypothetical protein [Spiribacter roseus]|uniref:hypothetical protein n=1 Tax=Spiribacter roseus TaxID=1855875 RepID=UPI0013308DC2|nr:hypothetical protein [Spiribacter roseus]KAF0281117.1 hypothetical protein BA900_01515 [Spiribacter roseus]
MSQRTTLQTLTALVLLRAGPQDLPFSTGLMGAAIAATAVINVPIIQRFTPDTSALLQISLLAVYNLAFLGVVLWLTGRGPRFIQSATALFGTDAVISLVGLPVLMLIGRPDEASALGALAFLGLLVWNIAVVSHIFRATLEWATPLSLGLTLAYIFGGSAFVRMAAGL